MPSPSSTNPVTSGAASPAAPPTNEASAQPPPVAPVPVPEQPPSPAPASAGHIRRAGEPPHRPEKKPAASAANCDPPYTVDEQGHKMYKMECLSQ
jgi:serine/threonine-protein kinase